MNSIPADAVSVALGAKLLLPLIEGKIPAGFPSPANDFLVKRHDLNELLITHPQATFFWQVSGHSMREAGIEDGAILVVNRALKPRHGCIVVAQVDGDFTVKTLYKRADRIKLVPANPTFPEITFRRMPSSPVTRTAGLCLMRGLACLRAGREEVAISESVL